MITGHYQNKLVNGKASVRPAELSEVLETKIIVEKPLNGCTQRVMVNLTDHTLTVGGVIYPVATSPKTPQGNFLCVEKWQNPFWRYQGEFLEHQGRVFVPGRDNPLGQYLVILYDLEKQRKSPYSIHMWPNPPHAAENFEQGEHGTGCIRTRREDMADIFKAIELGATIIQR